MDYQYCRPTIPFINIIITSLVSNIANNRQLLCITWSILLHLPMLIIKLMLIKTSKGHMVSEPKIETKINMYIQGEANVNCTLGENIANISHFSSVCVSSATQLTTNFPHIALVSPSASDWQVHVAQWLAHLTTKPNGLSSSPHRFTFLWDANLITNICLRVDSITSLSET